MSNNHIENAGKPFDRLMAGLIAVPKAELDRQIAKDRKAKGKPTKAAGKRAKKK